MNQLLIYKMCDAFGPNLTSDAQNELTYIHPLMSHTYRQNNKLCGYFVAAWCGSEEI